MAQDNWKVNKIAMTYSLSMSFQMTFVTVHQLILSTVTQRKICPKGLQNIEGILEGDRLNQSIKSKKIATLLLCKKT